MWVESFISGTVESHDFENFEKIDPDKAVLLVANHRSFNDQFAISARLFSMYGVHHNIFFPVRGNFFYDNPFGLIVNLFFAYGVMYPPIIRDRKRHNWNACATDIMVNLLREPGNLVGFHPEGTRGRSDDPYQLLPAKPGCGELIHRAQPNVVPVFLQGFPPAPFEMWREKLKKGKSAKTYVHMVMGEPVDFSEEYEMEASRKTYLSISKKAMRKIIELAEKEKRIRRLADNKTAGVSTAEAPSG
jgi:1-acyl-sn-glycerol-3-phosphate acyltransferase